MFQLRLLALLLLSIAPFARAQRELTSQLQEELAATWMHRQLQVSVPYHGLPGGTGRLTVELLSPEGDVLARADARADVEPSGRAWSLALVPNRSLPFEDLVWERVRVRFIPSGAISPALEEVRSVSEILRRPVVRLLGQRTYLAGAPAALRLVVTDGTPHPAPLTSGLVRIELLRKDDAPRPLFSGRIDHRGSVNAEFRFPSDLTGEVSLHIIAETPLGVAETTEPVRLEDKLSILLTTEKPLYQPSQTVHIRALALDRFDHHAAASRKLTFEIEDARGNKVFRKETETDSFGVASAEFVLADEVNLGAWHLRASMPSGSEDSPASSAERTLRIERYVLPKFRVAINLTQKNGRPQRDFRPGDHVTGVVKATYFFGKPVADASISLKVLGLDVTAFDAAEVEGHTGATGKYGFDLKLPAYFAGRASEKGAAPLNVEASVKDTAGHTETREEAITVTETPLLVQAIPEGGALAPGLDNVVYLMASYPDGTPARTTLHLRTKAGFDRIVDTAASGIATVRIQGSTGNAQLRCEIDDHQGKHAALSLRLDVRSGEDQVLLRTDRAIYKPGDTIALDVFSTRPRGTVYVDIIKDGQTLLTRDADLIDGAVHLSVPATAALSGTIELNAYVLGANSRLVRDHRLLFIEPAEDLHIEAHADAASYLPGSEAQVHFRVTDAHGRGVEAALGLEVVDEAVFALAEKQPGFAKVFFYLEQELMKPRFEIHALSPSEIVDTTMGSGDEDVRRNEAARMLFSAAVQIDPITLDSTFGQDLPASNREAFVARYRDAFLEQANHVAQDLQRYSDRKPQEIEAAFQSLRDAGASAPHDAWGTPLQFNQNYRYGGGRDVRLISAGPDRHFGTADDLAANLDLRQGTLLTLGGGGTIDLHIDHDRGPMNGLAEIGGIIGDMTGAVVPRAHIALQPLTAGGIRRTGSDDQGRFRFAGLSPGAYRVTIESAGFVAISRTITLQPRDLAEVHATLRVGAANGTITVETNAAVVAVDAVQNFALVENAAGLPLMARAQAAAKSAVLARTAPRGATTQTEAHTRSYFPEALFIAPEIITDSHGAAAVSIPIADSITTWRMAMFASSRGGALGTASSSLKVFQDFFVDLDLPVTITQGDRISIPVAIYNYAGRNDVVHLKLDQDAWFDMPDSGAEQTVRVAADQVGSAQFTLQAKHVGKFKLTLAAHMGDRQDTVVREIEVVPDGQPRETVFNGRLDAEGRTGAAQTVSFPAEALPEASKLFVRLYPGPMSQIVEGMDGILRLPYGCFEQTSSSTYPNVLALDYMKRTRKLTPEVHAKAEGFIATGYQRLLTFEVPGGGFSWFGRAPANKILTAYGLMEFHDMADVYAIDPRVIERTRDWLIAQQQEDGSWRPDTNFINEGATNRFNTDLVRITAYIAWSLEITGYTGPAVDKARQYLREHSAQSEPKLDAYTLAVLANFAVDGKTDAGWTRSILAQLQKAAHREGDQLWWTSEETSVYATGKSAAVETTGLAVQALLKSDEQNEEARKALNWLLAQKSGDGNWGSTQATIMALRALVLTSEKSGGDAVGSVEVLFNGSVVKTVALTKENNDLLQQLVLPAGSSNDIELRFHGSGGLAWQIDGRYFVPWGKDPTKEPLSIFVAYDRTKLAANDTVSAHAAIHNNTASIARMVMVDLGIPPGFDLATEDLQSLIEKSADAHTGRLEKFSLTATQAILYFDSIGAGQTVTVPFHLHARYPIRAKNFESRVYEYYDPAVSGSAKPVEFEVSGR